jgi:hypothetical protein
MTMADQHLRELLEDASADVPRRDLAAAALTGARRRRLKRRAGALAAVAVVGVTIGALSQGPALFTGNDGSGLVATEPGDYNRVAENAPVADTFTCPDTVAFPAPDLPEIYGGGPDLGVGHLGADRYEIVTEGDRRVLQVGDAEGNLRARVELLPGNDGPTIGAYERCTGPQGDDVPTDGRYVLGAHGRPIPDPPADLRHEAISDPKRTSSLVPVDDRAFFNRIGVVNRRTLYAYETTTGAGISEVARGQLAGSVSWGSGEGAQDIVGPNFIPMGDPEPRGSGFAGWTYYGTGEVVLTGRLSDGSTIEAQTFRGEDWKGAIHVLLAPLAELQQVTLETAEGETRVYDRGDF